MPITSKDLLDQLSDLQLALEGYSFEQLTVEEARALKSSFEAFRNQLETKIWDPGTLKPGNLPPQSPPATQEPTGILASVSHDLRDPLNGILGFTGLLTQTGLTDEQQNYLQAIRSASRGSLEILEELLQFARLKDGAEAPATVAFQPTKILREVQEYTRASLTGKPVDFELLVDGSLPETLVGNPSKLRRILVNLLGNAVKYTQKGRITLVVASQADGDRATLLLEVRDTGIGIPEGELPYIFKPYYQAGQTGKTAETGHGLGLSIVSKLLSETGGAIEVESQEGAGTVFRLQLPFGKETKKEVAKGAVNKPGAFFGEELRGKRILVFEDNPLNQKLLETRLKQWGCKVFHALKVPAGMRLLQEQPVDLILMDLRMPLMDGFQATRRIREHRDPAIRKIPILAVTADVNAGVREKYRESGMDDLLLKPYEAEALYAGIARLLRGYGNRKAVPEFNCEPLPELIPGEGLLDLDPLEAECMGDYRMLSDLVQLFRNNLLEFAGRMKFYLREGDRLAIQGCAHKVLSGLKLIKATGMLRVVEEIHKAAGAPGDLRRAGEAYQQFLDLYPLLEEALLEELDKRK